MSSYNYRQNREEIQELLHQYENLKSGRSHSFLEEDAFEKIIDYYDEREELSKSEPGMMFLADQNAFYWMIQKPEVAAIIHKEGHIETTTSRLFEA